MKSANKKDRWSAIALVSRILLPLVFVLILDLSPLPDRVSRAAREAYAAASQDQPVYEVDHLGELVEFYPWRFDLWERLGIRAVDARQPEKAILALQQAGSEASLSNNGWLAMGDAYYQQGEYQLAAATWEALKGVSGPSTELFQRLESAYRAEGSTEGMRSLLQAWAEWSPADAQVVYRWGLWLAADQPAAGLNVLLKAAQLDPKLYPKVRILQAGINAAIASDDLAYNLLMAGRAMISLDEWEAAEAAFQKAVRINSSYADAWAFLSEARQHLGQDGLPALNQALALDPTSLLVQAVQAMYWQERGNLEKAEVILKKIAALEPENGVWQISLGSLEAQKGDLLAALAYYQKAVQVDEGNPVYWRELASFCVNFEVQVSEVGLPAARQAVALAGDDASNLDVLGQALAGVQDLESAQRFYQRAIQQDSQYAPAYLHLGLVYLTQGEQEQAVELLKEAVRLAPAQPAGEQAQRILERYSH
jgi:tetratricopeptide (TPR) repeat protein